MQIELLVVDPQNDFCHPNGSLYVPGATEDMARLAAMIIRLKKKIDDIHVTLDSHHFVDIAHPIFWINSAGKHPDPFTVISVSDVKQGLYRSTNPQFQKRVQDYVQALEDNQRYPLCIWPPHCLIGSWGGSVINEKPDAPLFDAFLEWEEQFGIIDYVTKGSNYRTEHYSAVKADVVDTSDPDTNINMKLIDTLEKADVILLAGEARSHCLANTVIDIADEFGKESIKKMVLLTDATSDVADPPGTTLFSDIGNKFVADMQARGMQVSTTKEYLL